MENVIKVDVAHLSESSLEAIKNTKTPLKFLISLNAWDRESYQKINNRDEFFLILANICDLKTSENVSVEAELIYNSKECFTKLTELSKYLIENFEVPCTLKIDSKYNSFDELPETI